MRVPDVTGMKLAAAEELLQRSGIAYSVEAIAPPRDRRGDEEKQKGFLRVLRVEQESAERLRILVCRV